MVHGATTRSNDNRFTKGLNRENSIAGQPSKCPSPVSNSLANFHQKQNLPQDDPPKKAGRNVKRWANEIGPNLRKIRLRRGLTQEQLAARLQIAEADMTRQVVANIEARRRRVYENHIRGIIKVLRCDLNELFFGVPPAPDSHRPTRSKPSRR